MNWHADFNLLLEYNFYVHFKSYDVKRPFLHRFIIKKPTTSVKKLIGFI